MRIDAEQRLVASVREADGKRAVVECSREAAGKERTRAVRSVRVPGEWRDGMR